MLQIHHQTANLKNYYYKCVYFSDVWKPSDVPKFQAAVSGWRYVYKHVDATCNKTDNIRVNLTQYINNILVQLSFRGDAEKKFVLDRQY